MQKLQRPCDVNQHVDVRGEPWIVIDVERYPRCAIITLRGRGHDNLGATTRVIAPFDHIDVVTPNRTPLLSDREAVLFRAARAVVRSHRWDECWTAATARIDLLPWQMQPALAAIRGATRLLLADSVGLGKTIEAALILTELRARRLVTRTLILTPASLREQWASELCDRFGVDAVVHDHDALGRLCASLPPGINPWSTSEVIVSSIDLVKRPEVRAAVDAVPFDLLIVDEAHHVTPGTDRGAVVEALASRVPWVVLATATPHSGDQRAYEYLQNLGAVGTGDTIAVFRRSHAAVGRNGARRVHLQPVHTESSERTLLDATMAYAKQMWSGRGQADPQVRLVAAVIARRAASSRRAILRTLERRHQLLSVDGAPDMLQAILPWGEGDDADAQTPDRHLSCAGPGDHSSEIQVLERLLSLAHSAGEAKMRALRRLLLRIDEPALVFSEYRDTIESYSEAFGDLAAVGVLHGGLTTTARREAIHAFVSGRTRILFATDAAGEGLNLQRRCRLVINIELPWNPLRLEQRIGRVDRFGQHRRVHAIHLFHRGSFEERVLAQLERRMRAAKVTVGAATVSEDQIAAAVFAEEDLQPIRPDTCVAERDEAPLSVLTTKRRLIASISRNQRQLSADRPLVCGPVDQNDETRFLLLFEADIRDSHEHVIERHVIGVGVSLCTAVGASRDIPGVLQALGDCVTIDDVLREQIALRLALLRDDLRATADVLRRRLIGIRSHIDAQSRAQVRQGSLFDKRAERRAQAHAAALADCREQIERRLASTDALAAIRSGGRATLVAAWATH